MPKPFLFPLASVLLLGGAGCSGAPAAPVVIDTVSGTVVDSDGTPVSGTSVALGAAVVVTDASGRFTFSSVTSPYDLLLTPVSRPYAFIGLTGATPTVKLWDFYTGELTTSSGANLSLHLPVTGAEQVAFILDRPDELAPITTPFVTPAAPGEIPLGVEWPGQGPAKVRVQAFRYEPAADGTPQHYTGYSTTDLTLQADDAVEWTAVWQTPTFKETKISITASLPSDYQVYQSSLLTSQNGAKEGQPFAWSKGTGASLSFVVPALDGPIFALQVCASNGFSASCRTQPGLVAGTSRAVTVDPGPELALQSATVGVGTEIDWSANGDGASFVMFTPGTGTASTAPSYFIATDGPPLTFPDLGKLGTKLPKGANYELGVFRDGATATVDDLAADGPLVAPTDGPAITYAYTIEVPVTTP